MRRIICAFALPSDFVDPSQKEELSECGELRLYRLAVRLTSLFPSTFGHVKVYTEGITLPNLHARVLIEHLIVQSKEHPRVQMNVDYDEMEDVTDFNSFILALKEMRSEATRERRVDSPIFIFSTGNLLREVMDYYEDAAAGLDYEILMRYPLSEHYLAAVVDFQTKKIDTITDSLLPRKNKAAT